MCAIENMKEREKSGDLDVVVMVIQSVQIMTASNTVVISSRSRLVWRFHIVMC